MVNVEEKNVKMYLGIFFFILISLFTGCKKLVEIPAPTASLSSDNVYSTDATAASVLTGIYSNMSSPSPLNFAASINSVSIASGLSCDELTLFGGVSNANSELAKYYLNKLISGLPNTPGVSIWNAFYRNLYTVNIVLEKLAGSNNLTPNVKRQLMGEAKFLRAFFYFYLVNLYGDIPLTTTSNYSFNNTLFRIAKAQVYQQVIFDLKDAQNLLSDGYVDADAKTSTLERVRPNKWAATALLARAYLYTNKYDSAEAQASTIIKIASMYSLNTLNTAFLKNSNEAIWQLQPVNTGWNTEDAKIFILPVTGPTNSTYPIYLAPQLINGFEPGDQRRSRWIDSVLVNGFTYYYPNKYKSANLNAPVTEYLMVLRLGEQYLIRAEARVQQNNIGGAQDDLNVIRTRAGLQNINTSDRTSLLGSVQHERQVELFTEWGNRWLDLKRTRSIDEVMTAVSSVKGTTWNTDWQWYPIPAYDILQDPNLVQNPGY